MRKMIVEFRVLPLGRFLRDTLYWWYGMVWFSFPCPVYMWAIRHGFLTGFRGYFEWRAGIEYPVLQRWASMDWKRRRRVNANNHP